jgi:SAM-dependent methyltransferase
MNENLDNEREFHDEWARSTDPNSVDVYGAWEVLATPETFWIKEHLGDLSGLSVLDLGCGLGEGAVFFALQGANVTASDLSPEMLEITRKVAELHRVSLTTVVASATDLSSFGAASFDVVYGANMLHHVDIKACLNEVFRVLKPGGRAAFWDPVQYNPVINIYRKMASGVRTDDEHPLRTADVRFARHLFGKSEIRFFWLTATAIFIRFYLVDKIAPSEGRYWKLIIDRRSKHAKFLRRAHRVDSLILKLIPPLKWWCWNIAMVLTKEN